MNSRFWLGPALAVSVMALSIAQIEAQVTSASAAGRITDTAGERVANATVEILHEPTGTLHVTTTDGESR